MPREVRIDSFKRRGDGRVIVMFTEGKPPLPAPNFKRVIEFTSYNDLLEAVDGMEDDGAMSLLLLAISAALSTDRALGGEIGNRSVTLDTRAGTVVCHG